MVYKVLSSSIVLAVLYDTVTVYPCLRRNGLEKYDNFDNIKKTYFIRVEIKQNFETSQFFHLLVFKRM